MGAVPLTILSLWNYFSDLRRGDNFPFAIRRRVHGTVCWWIYRDNDFSFIAGGRFGLGMDERCFDVEVRIFLNLNPNRNLNRNLESEIKNKIKIRIKTAK